MTISDSENERQPLDPHLGRLSPSNLMDTDGVIALAVVVVFVVTGFFFPALSYISIVAFGFPASAVVLIACVGWLLLRRVRRRLADACAVAFILPVSFCLVVMGSMRLDIAILILLPSGLLWAATWIIGRLRQRPTTIEN
jgi:hypothetical protein